MEIFTEKMLAALPTESRKKAIRLDEDRQAAWAAVRLATEALDDARNRLDLTKLAIQRRMYAEDGARRRLTEAEIAEIEAPARRIDAEIEERLAPRLRRAESAWRDHDYLGAVGTWLTEAVASGARLRHVPLPAFKGDAHRVVEEARRKLDEIDAAFRQVAEAARPVSELRAAMLAELDRLADDGKPACDPRIRAGSPVKLGFALGLEGQGNRAATLSHTLVWLLRDELAAKLDRLLPGDELPGAMTDEARDAAIDRLSAERLEVERSEEAAIAAAATAGMVIARRVDADPRAVLELGV